jgi:hypothetical protein
VGDTPALEGGAVAAAVAVGVVVGWLTEQAVRTSTMSATKAAGRVRVRNIEDVSWQRGRARVVRPAYRMVGVPSEDRMRAARGAGEGTER